jgi:hypothetical protein
MVTITLTWLAMPTLLLMQIPYNCLYSLLIFLATGSKKSLPLFCQSPKYEVTRKPNYPSGKKGWN